MSKIVLNRAQSAFLAETFARNRALFGGWSMDAAEDAAAKAAADKAAADKAAADKAAADKAAAEKAAAERFEPVTSQEEFDRRLAGRLQREREKFADYDDLKKKAEAHDKAAADAQTEHEKAVEAARKEGETSALERANVLLVRAKAETMAAQARFAAPEAVVASLNLSSIKVDDAGKVDTDALKVQIDAAAASGAFVIGDGKTRPRPDHSQGGGGGGTNDTPSVSRGADLFAEKRGKKTQTAS